MKLLSASARSEVSKPLSHLRCGEEPQLAEFRRALVGRRHEPLVVGAFAVVVLFSFIVLVHRGGLISSQNQYAVDAGAAIATLSREARNGVSTVAATAQDAAGAARNRLSATVVALRAPLAHLSATSVARTRSAGVGAHLARHGRSSSALGHAAKVPVGHKASAPALASVRHRAPAAAETVYVGSLSQRISDLLQEFPQRLSDECGKAYYEFLNFAAGTIDWRSSGGFRMKAEQWMDWIQGSSPVNLAIAGGGVIFLTMLFLGLVIQVREVFENSTRRMHRRRVGGIA